MSIGSRIKKRRKELDMTQQELAEKTGYKCKSIISCYEKDKRIMSEEILEKFSRALNCSVEYLVSGSKENNNPLSFSAQNSSADSITCCNTRQAFVDSFWQLYIKKDIQKIKVNEICDLAGYHRNSFYRYFSDVHDVLSYIYDNIITEIISVYDKDFSEENVSVYIEEFINIWERNSKYLKVFADTKKNSSFYMILSEKLIDFLHCNFSFCDNEEQSYYLMKYQISGSIYTLMNYYTQETRELRLEDLIWLLHSINRGRLFPSMKNETSSLN